MDITEEAIAGGAEARLSLACARLCLRAAAACQGSVCCGAHPGGHALAAALWAVRARRADMRRSEAGCARKLQALSALVTEAMKDAHSKSVDVRWRTTLTLNMHVGQHACLLSQVVLLCNSASGHTCLAPHGC